jgi:hypothetical protein
LRGPILSDMLTVVKSGFSNDSRKRLRWSSAAAGICWLVLSGVTFVIAPYLVMSEAAISLTLTHWLPMSGWVCGAIGVGSLLQEHWGAPAWVGEVLLALGVLVWGYVIFQCFIVPPHATLVN